MPKTESHKFIDSPFKNPLKPYCLLISLVLSMKLRYYPVSGMMLSSILVLMTQKGWVMIEAKTPASRLAYETAIMVDQLELR